MIEGKQAIREKLISLISTSGLSSQILWITLPCMFLFSIFFKRTFFCSLAVSSFFSLQACFILYGRCQSTILRRNPPLKQGFLVEFFSFFSTNPSSCCRIILSLFSKTKFPNVNFFFHVNIHHVLTQ